jgi:large subunit ribosomal protein L24
MSKFHVKKGDTIAIISGEEAGKQGKVLFVMPKSGRALVEGLNLVKRHTKKSQKNQKGGIVEKEAPLPLAKLRVVTEAEKKAAKKSAKTE